MSQPPVLCISGFRLFFLTSSVPLALFQLPFGRGGRVARDVPTSRTLHSRLPLLFVGFDCEIFSKHLKSKVSFQKRDKFRKSNIFTGKSKMKPKIRDFFNQRKQDKNQNKYQMLVFPCVEDYCNRRKQDSHTNHLPRSIDFLKIGTLSTL